MSEILKELQLSPTDEKVYLLLLTTGQLAISEIAALADIKVSDVETSIKNLAARELIFINPSIIKKYSATYPLVSLSTKAKGSLDTIKKIGDEVNSYAEEKFTSLDRIVNKQKESLKNISSSTKEIVRKETEASVNEITSELDKLIEEIGQILNIEKQQISSMSIANTTELSKNYQSTNETAGNIINTSARDIVNSLAKSDAQITKSFHDTSAKISDACKIMESSVHTSLENTFKENIKTTHEIQQKINNSSALYDASAKDTMSIFGQAVREDYSKIVELVNNKLGLHDKETNQILEERIRNIIQSMNEMNDDFAKVVKDRLSGIRREYNQMIESFTRNAETLFTDANAQIEGIVAAKTSTNEQIMNDLFKLLKDNLQKNANDAREEIKSKEIRLGNELKSQVENTHRKMTEINDKLKLELANGFNKANTDFETSKSNIISIVSRAKTDINTKFTEAVDTTSASIKKEFSEKEKDFTNVSSKLIEDIKALNNASEARGKNFIKETEQSAKTAIAKIEMPAKTLLNRGKQTALKFVNEQASLVNKTIDQSQVGIEDSIIAETANVKNQFKGFGEKYKENNKTIERLLANMELTYMELVEKIKDLPRANINTMSIIGKDAILSQITEIFKRVKSTVTVIYPNINDIPISLLENSNPRTRIIVISDFDPFKNQDIIKRLMSKENIQLKSLAIGSTTTPYYGIGRDAEEGLIGTLDESGQVIAITSTSPAFVELISSEIINGIITPKTKRVVLPESQ
ncbi:MAG: hypothetical protein JXA54_02180 [Candidatus Heimdallarchaeota archaeon]|nr:hypothetical protein [Candidatus Heimdallarchaeota archaeon]